KGSQSDQSADHRRPVVADLSAGAGRADSWHCAGRLLPDPAIRGIPVVPRGLSRPRGPRAGLLWRTDFSQSILGYLPADPVLRPAGMVRTGLFHGVADHPRQLHPRAARTPATAPQHPQATPAITAQYDGSTA